MALSFGESLKAAQAESEAAAVSATLSVMADEPSVMSLDDSDYGVATLSYGGDGGETWQWDSKYDRYSGEDGVAFSFGYDDTNISTVSSTKTVTLDSRQMNINQEHRSQFIPFEMPRYYDGYDLLNATICVNYRRSDGDVRTKKAVNVRYSKDKIRFGWLVEAHATEVAGKLEFEIVAFGSDYIWKSRMVNSMNVIESIPFSSELVSISSDETWISEIVEAVAGEIVGMEFSEQLTEANAAAEEAKAAAEEAKESADAAEAAAEAKVNEVLGSYATKTYVDAAVDAIDVTDQLANYVTSDTLANNYYTKDETQTKINASLEDYATKEDVSDAISSADLDSYYKKDETYSQEEIDEKLGNVSVDLSGYATEAYVNNQIAPLSSGVETNASNIGSLSTTVSALQETVDSIDTSPRLTYDVAYNDADDEDVGENVFVFYEIENEGEENEVKSAKKKFTIVGGGGGGGTSSTIKIGYITSSPLVVTTNDKAIIEYNFSGTDSSGDIVPEGVATWKVGGKLVATNTAVAGDNSFDITDYISIGTQKVLLTITDDAGSLATKTWTVQQVDVKLESDFNDAITYPIGEVSFAYKPYGSIDKTVHFKLDDVEIGTVNTKSSGIPMSYTLPSQSHGSHLVEAYITAELNGNTIESNHIYKDVIWYDSSSGVPVISCTQQNITAKQYDSTNIVYTVYDPDTETPTVTLAIDGEVTSTLKLDTPTNTWQYKSSDVGDHILTITCGETVKTINITIEELDIDVTPVTAGLAFDFNPTGYSNNDADRLWSDGDVAMTVSDNFDWTNGGYQIDESGDQYFCVKAGTTATINYNLFSDDPKRNGKEFKFIFKTTNVKNRATSFLTCLNNGIGLDMKVESANVYSSNDSLYSPYCEDDIIEFEFNINKDTDIPMVLTYEDGVANRPMIYTSDSSFMQSEPQPITIGCDDCDVYIYRMKAYSNGLSDSDILSNFIADARSAEEMISRYDRNQIYDENGTLTPEVLAEKCPDLRIILVDCPRFTTDKSDKVTGTTISMIYKNGDPVLDNWTCENAAVSGQGTSSNEYGYAGRNLDLIMNYSDSLFTFGDGETTGTTFTFTRDSMPVNYANVKVNIASSENQNNAQMTMRYNEYNPYVRPARLVDSRKRDTMAFYDCVVFVREYNEDLSTHNEFSDTSYHKVA